MQDISVTDLRNIVDTSVRLIKVLEPDDLLSLRLEMVKDRALKEIQRRQ